MIKSNLLHWFPWCLVARTHSSLSAALEVGFLCILFSLTMIPMNETAETTRRFLRYWNIRWTWMSVPLLESSMMSKVCLWGEYWHAMVALSLQGCQSGRRSMMAAAELHAAVCHHISFIYYMFLWEDFILVLQYCFTIMYMVCCPMFCVVMSSLKYTWLNPFWPWFL